MNKQDQFEYEVWCAHQELTMDDVCICINDSKAILRAIHSNNFYDAVALIKNRVETSVKRLAEYRMYGDFKTQPIDDKQELATYIKVVNDRVSRVADQFRSFQ